MDLVRESIKDLVNYQITNRPYRVKLDANEGENIILDTKSNLDKDLNINLYPDSNAERLREELGKYLGIDCSNIIAGNGSSEMIDLIMKTFIDSGDTIMTFIPTFSMYSIYSHIYDGGFVGIESEEDFSLDVDKLIKEEERLKPKMILLCNPNNPTGYQLSVKEIRKILDRTKALVIVDEAYMEFSSGSMIYELDDYSNLIILRTLSKAFGLAGIRLGYMVSNQGIIQAVNKVKAPYNLNSITQHIGIKALERRERMEDYIKAVKKERKRVYILLRELNFQVYDSYGNFLFFKSDIKGLYNRLERKGILIRHFSYRLKDYYRVSIGNEEENNEFIKCLKEIVKDEKN